MPDLDWNKRRWNDTYAWPQSGDEWSRHWGGPRAQWYGTIYPRIARWLPARNLLEIAPGFGRWTQFLLRQTDCYYGVDMNPKCISMCRQRFVSANRALFFQNDGRSLRDVPEGCIDFVFSFDSLVHVELDVLGEYCQQIVEKLTTNGVAFLHHSNALKERDETQPNANGRGTTVSSAAIREIIDRVGGRTLLQEEINWESKKRTDCLTTFCRSAGFPNLDYALIENDHFMLEAHLIRATQSRYQAM
jgi:SAM-dependent methyltransferase